MGDKTCKSYITSDSAKQCSIFILQKITMLFSKVSWYKDEDINILIKQNKVAKPSNEENDVRSK